MEIECDNINICMILHNEEKIIRHCLSALQSAGFRSFILLDNGSTDQTARVASEAIMTDVKIVDAPQRALLNIGYGELRNTCAAFATLPWLLFVDADEILSGGVRNGRISIEGGGGDIYAIRRRNLRPGDDAATASTELHFRLYRSSFLVRWQGYIHEEVVSLTGQSTIGALSSLNFNHYSGLLSSDEDEKSGRYSLMMLRAFKYPHLRVGTNEWWYCEYVPREKKSLLLKARAYAERHAIDTRTFDPDEP